MIVIFNAVLCTLSQNVQDDSVAPGMSNLREELKRKDTGMADLRQQIVSSEYSEQPQRA